MVIGDGSKTSDRTARSGAALPDEGARESLGTKLAREASLIGDGLAGAVENGWREAKADPVGTGIRLAGSIGLGLVLGAAQRRAGLLALGAEVTGASMTTMFAADVLAPGRWHQAWDAISATYRSPSNYRAHVQELQSSAGRLIVDTAAATLLGVGTAKLTQSALLPGEPTLTDALMGKIGVGSRDLGGTIAGRTPVSDLTRTAGRAAVNTRLAPEVRVVPPGSGQELQPLSATADAAQPAAWIAPQLGALDRSQMENIAGVFGGNGKANVTPEQIMAVRSDINTYAQDPSVVLPDLMRNNRILGIGEKHHEFNPQRDFVAGIMPQLRAAGATHMAVEMDARYQPILDRFARTGQLQAADRQAVRGLLNDRSYLQLLSSARDSGLKLVGVDSQSRDVTMSKMISDILEADPQNKVVFWVGANHLGTEPVFGQTAFAMLSKKYGFATVGYAMDDNRLGYTSRLSYVAHDLVSPALVSTAEAKNIARLPASATGTYGNWQYVLIHPGTRAAQELKEIIFE